MRILQGKAEIDREAWTSLLESNRYASPFQSPEFLDLFNAASGPQSADVYAVETHDRLIALCVVTLQKERGLKGFFSRRAIVYGGPLLSGDEAAGLQFLLKAIEKNLRRKVIYLEIRNFHDYRMLFPVYEKGRWSYLPYLNLRILLKGRSFEDILGGMKYNRRREIRLSLQEGATYRPAETEDEVRDLYDLLCDLYRERVKLPLPGLSFFTSLFRSGAGIVFVVRHQEKIIGGAFCLCLRGGGIYTFYYCGIRDYHKKIFPTHLAVLAAIEHGRQNGLEYLDFMGVGCKGKEYGVRKYKMEFGGEQEEQGRFLKVLNQPLYRIGKLGLTAMQKVK